MLKKEPTFGATLKPAFEKRYALTKTDQFISAMTEEIKKKKADYVRVHDSGDYYSPKYLQKWLTIAKNNPNVRFYSYTNSIQFIKDLKSIPSKLRFYIF